MKNARQSGHSCKPKSLHPVAHRRTMMAMHDALHVLGVMLHHMLDGMNRMRRHDNGAGRLRERTRSEQAGDEDSEEFFHEDFSVVIDLKPLNE